MLNDFIKDEVNRDTAKIHVGTDGDFIEIKPSTDKKFVNARSLVFKRLKHKIKKKPLTADEAQMHIGPLIAKHLMVDWQATITKEALSAHFPDIKGKAIKDNANDVLIPFTDENVKAVLTHNKYGEFLDFILEQANETANFIEDEKAEDSKN